MWFWLALASALLGAIDIAINKKVLNKVSATTLNWSLYALSLPFLILLALKEGMPQINLVFLIAILGSAVTFAIGKNIIYSALKDGLISKIIPLTSFSSIFTYFFGIIFLGETLRPIPVLGLFSIVAGSYILNADQAREDILKPFKLLFTSKSSLLFMFALILTSMTVIFDKLGILNTNPQSPAFVLLTENIVMSTLLAAYLQVKEKNTWRKQLKNNFLGLLINSFVYLTIAYLVFVAYSIQGPVALVIGIKRLQIFFVLILGYFFLKDKPTKHVWIAAVIMIFGVLMIRLG